MEAFTCIPKGLQTLVTINAISLAFVGSAAAIFLMYIAGPIGLIIPAIISGIFIYFFKRKK